MLPSIGVSLLSGGLGAPSAVASVLGSATLGTSAGGNAYKEGRNRGYSHGEALAYGVLTGASEAGLQAVLGGISSLGLGITEEAAGGAISRALGKVIKNTGVTDAIGRYIANMGSEATEEYLQSVLEPVFRNIAAGERNTVNLLDEEAIYSGILGALTAGLFETPSLISGMSGARNTSIDPYTSPELRTAQEAAGRFFTPEEISDPNKLNARMREYAREYADVRNQANPDPVRQSELASIQSAYNDIKNAANPREYISTEQAVQTAPQNSVVRGAENNSPNAANTAETPVATRETHTSADVRQPDISAAAKTALENITKAGELNTPYETIVNAYREKIETGVISAQDVSDAYAAGLARYNKANTVQTGNANIQENALHEDASDGIMSADEEGAILQYKSGSTSYTLNEKLYSGAELSPEDKALADNLDKALNKLPNYKGTTYRELSFDRQGEAARDAFVAMHVPGMYVNYGSYTSSSKTQGAYDVDGALKVKVEIEGHTGKDVSKNFGLEAEQEVIYGRDVDYITESIETAQDGTVVIKIKEVSQYDESVLPIRRESVDGSDIGKSSTVREMQEGKGHKRSGHTDMRSVPERDSQSGIQRGSESLQGELSGGQRNAGNTEGRVSKQPTTENRVSKEGTEFSSSLLFNPSDGKGHAATTVSGKAVSAGGIVTADGKTKVRLSDGTTAPLSDIDFDDPDISTLYERAASFDADTANALIRNYTGETSVDNYLRAFNSVYLSGKAGLPYEQAVGRSLYAGHYLNDGAKAAAYRAGQAAYDTARTNSIAGQKGKNIRPQAKGRYKAGVNREYSNKKLSHSQRAQLRALDEVAKAHGKKIVVHDKIGTTDGLVVYDRSDANAYYDPATDTYHVSLDGVGQAYAFFTVHESIHEMRFKNKEGLDALSEVTEAAIVGELMNQKGMTFDEAKAEFEKMVRYQMDKNGVNRDDAVVEVVANTVPVILADEQQGKRFADKVLKSGSKVRAWFEKLLQELRAIFDEAYRILRREKSWEQMELIRNNKQTLDLIADYYFEGMEGTKGKAANEDGKVSFSPRLDPDFGSSVDIEKNYRAVANMQPVAKVKGTEFAKGEVDLITQVSNFFEEIGGEVISPDLGRIILDRNGVKDDIAHGIGRNKAAAFVAVPDVIKKGKILDVQYNWKGRGYDTVIVAAPVVFSGQNAVEGVILRKKSINDDFYLHEIKIEGVSTFKTGANKNGAPSADTPSVISILQKVFDYKEKSDGNVKLSAKDINADIREVNPMEITPPNRVTSSSKYHYLINEFENNGYNGRRVVLVENGNDGYQALTGSHRILAALEAGVDVPSVVIPMSEEIQPLLDATGDEERARIADELYEDGIIPKEARDLLVREDELNFENLGKQLDKQARFSKKDREAQAKVTAQYKQQVQKILNDKSRPSTSVLVGYTPELYRKLGMPDLPFVVGSGHVYSMAKTKAEAIADGNAIKGVNYHGLGSDVVENILDYVKNPVMVISSKDVSRSATPLRSTHSVVALIDVNKGRESLVIPVEITAERTVDGDRIDVNVISSAYEKTTTSLVNEAIAQFNAGENSIFYIKKEADKLIGAGVQFPTRLKQIAASDGIICKLGSKINMSVQNVTESQQFKRWFGDWQNHPESASKVVNKDREARKDAQFALIQNSNAAHDDYHTWIRSADEIKTLEETLADPDWEEYAEYDPDYTREMAEAAIKSGKITVYSSYKIGDGVFVTPSRMEAESYAADGKVYSKTVNVNDIAWIDPTQGQYAPVKVSPNYDYSKSFAEQLDYWKAGKIAKNDTLIVGATPKVFREIGFNALPVTINQTHVDYAINGTKNAEHHIGEAMLKQLPDAIKTPVAIIASETRGQTSVVALLPFTKNGRTIVVPVYVDGFGFQNGVRFDNNAITSIYGRKNAVTTLLTNAIARHNNGEMTLFYLDKGKATALYQGARVTMPKMLIKNNGFVHSIRESGSPVKPKFGNVTESQQCTCEKA